MHGKLKKKNAIKFTFPYCAPASKIATRSPFTGVGLRFPSTSFPLFASIVNYYEKERHWLID
jgi:hypothetical protein